MNWRYWLTIFLIRRVLFPYWQPQLRGLRNLPAEGPFILAGNHPTMLDPFLVAACIPRRLDFLAGPYVLKLPVLGPWLRAMGVLAANGENFYEALRRLREGGPIGIFPEGRNSLAEGLREFQPGVAVLAKRSGVPVIPVGTWGNQEALPAGATFVRSATVRLTFGPPLVCGRDESIKAFLARLTRAVQDQIHEPTAPPRTGLGYQLARLFWVPFSWLVFRLAAGPAAASAASGRARTARRSDPR